MLVECGKCSARVDGKLLAEVPYQDDGEPPSRHVFLQCPACGGAILIDQSDYGGGWETFTRLYPPQRQAHFRLPNNVRLSFDEALKCFQAKAYIAAVLMCRRTLESVCHHHVANMRTLQHGIEELGRQKIIDGKLVEWADALRRDGNLAAHDPTSKVEQQDASDLVDFTQALLEYVFILEQKFQAFKERRAGGANGTPDGGANSTPNESPP